MDHMHDTSRENERPSARIGGEDLDGVSGRVPYIAGTGSVAVRLERAELLSLRAHESHMRRVLTGDNEGESGVGETEQRPRLIAILHFATEVLRIPVHCRADVAHWDRDVIEAVKLRHRSIILRGSARLRL